MLSEAVEDYLKAIYTIADGTKPVSTSAIATRLGVAPASVTQMLKKLAEMKPRLVLYKRHHGVQLTPHGEKVALEVIRHHRLVELFLQEALGMSWDEVDKEAERLEHVVSETLADRMAEKLGHPQFDPHGDPIPSKSGAMPEGEALFEPDSGTGGPALQLSGAYATTTRRYSATWPTWESSRGRRSCSRKRRLLTARSMCR